MANELRDLDLTSLDELRGRTPDELGDIAKLAEAHMRALHYDDSGGLRGRLDEAEQTAFDFASQIRTEALDMIDKHQEVRNVLSRRPKQVEAAMLSMGVRDDDAYGDVRRMSVGEARNAALRRLDSRDDTRHMTDDAKTEAERNIRTSTDIARRVLVTETDAYRAAWQKMVCFPHGALLLDNEERDAIRAYHEYRAMSENTTTAGGFGIPVFIDPSIILTAQESGNPFLEICDQVNVNTNEWKGVSSAGVTWTFQTEAAQVSDASPTLAQPTVHIHMARGFVPFSIEVDQDYPSFASEMQKLLAEGYDELLVDKFTRGSGSGEPFGILTALSANTNVRVRVQTSGTNFSTSDPYTVWKALPQKSRRRASWMMSVGVNNALRQLGTANVFHAYTENLPVEWADNFFGKKAYESPYMPDTTTSTSATDGLAIVGNFQRFKIARRGGMSIELIQHLFQQTTAGTGVGLPTGQRGWFAYARIGSDSTDDTAFRLLVNT